MYLKCSITGHERIKTDLRGMAKFLREGGIIGKRGEIKNELTVYMGGPFFKALKDEGELYPWVFSTFNRDREDERIDPAGWDLAHYLNCPTVLWSHDRWTPAIGYAEGTEVKDGKLKGNIRFNSREFDPFGWSIGERVKYGSLKSGSVGFILKRVEIKGQGDECEVILREQELLEFSICNVPANPFALSETAVNGSDVRRRGAERKSFFYGLIKNKTEVSA